MYLVKDSWLFHPVVRSTAPQQKVPFGASPKAGLCMADTFTEFQDPLGRTVSYIYQSGGHLLTFTDKCGIQYLENTYSANGRMVRQLMGDGGE